MDGALAVREWRSRKATPAASPLTSREFREACKPQPRQRTRGQWEARVTTKGGRTRVVARSDDVTVLNARAYFPLRHCDTSLVELAKSGKRWR